MAKPPLLAGAVHERYTRPSKGDASKLCGDVATPPGVAVTELMADVVPSPNGVMAVTM